MPAIEDSSARHTRQAPERPRGREILHELVGRADVLGRSSREIADLADQKII
ncbi:hypothetical protein ACQP1K_19895 [Sphaerimonospora sp. CA-214678]|uniref:hypothetical protein n=1 Tax=Sphaerimonospora sp. CA-214678 TaxID=3240029 RepID=UPI003D8A0498